MYLLGDPLALRAVEVALHRNMTRAQVYRKVWPYVVRSIGGWFSNDPAFLDPVLGPAKFREAWEKHDPEFLRKNEFNVNDNTRLPSSRQTGLPFTLRVMRSNNAEVVDVLTPDGERADEFYDPPVESLLIATRNWTPLTDAATVVMKVSRSLKLFIFILRGAQSVLFLLFCRNLIDTFHVS